MKKTFPAGRSPSGAWPKGQSPSGTSNYIIINKDLWNYPSLEHGIKFEDNKVGVIIRGKPGFYANLYYLLHLLGVGCFNLDFYLLVTSSK